MNWDLLCFLNLRIYVCHQLWKIFCRYIFPPCSLRIPILVLLYSVSLNFKKKNILFLFALFHILVTFLLFYFLLQKFSFLLYLTCCSINYIFFRSCIFSFVKCAWSYFVSWFFPVTFNCLVFFKTCWVSWIVFNVLTFCVS